MTQLAMPIGRTDGDMITFTIHLPFLPPSKNRTESWPGQWRSAAKKKWFRAIEKAVREQDIPKGCRHVALATCLVFPQPGRRDAHNYGYNVVHWVCDALVKLEVIPDDTPQYVTVGDNCGVEFTYDIRKHVHPDKRRRTIISLALQV